jgi:signal transduction histidine kinase
VTNRRTRFSGVTLLAAAVVVLLPALAWLQYSWLEQIADSDRERRARTLQTSAAQLTQDFDAEIGRAVFALQIDSSSIEQADWSGYAQKYQVWTASAASPRIVKSIYFVEAGDERIPTDTAPLRIWNAQTNRFDETPWPEEFASIRSRFVHESVAVIDMPVPGERRPASARGTRVPIQRMVFPPTATGDDQSIVTPVLRITPPPPDAPDARSDVKMLGFTIIRFDLDALGRDVLPSLVRKHFYSEDGETDFAIAVVAREDARVIFESQPGAAETASARPDATAALLGPRMGQFLFMARATEGRRVIGAGAPPPPPPPPASEDDVVVNVIETKREGGGTVSVQRATIAGEGQWRLIAKHRAGSLEAAVAAARTRNFALSSGILALLAAAIGLIVVAARRADRLARQQLEFVAAVSHELRTPVSVIGAAAGNLADGVVDEPGRVKKYGATIQTEARRLGETVERVLQLAGIAAGGAAVARTALSVPALVENAVAATRHESDAAGVTVEVNIADDLRQSPTDLHGVQRVVGDATALQSAIQNLISNAVKYGGDARWVRVTARALTHNATRITVEDRGLGIAADDRKHIFEPFYRGREAVSRQIQGSGLGLHLVQRIVSAHGGTVAVDSEPGRGSTFTIDLPGVHEVLVRKQPSSLVRRLARLT